MPGCLVAKDIDAAAGPAGEALHKVSSTWQTLHLKVSLLDVLALYS